MRRALQNNLITSDKDYSKSEMEFLKAVEDYIHYTGRKFPPWTEIFKVLIMLGYRKETIPISTEIAFKSYDARDRRDILRLWPVRNWTTPYTDWSTGTYLIRKSFKDFNSAYGIYFGGCKDGFAVGLMKLNLHHIYRFEVYKTLEDLKFVWEVNFDS